MTDDIESRIPSAEELFERVKTFNSGESKTDLRVL